MALRVMAVLFCSVCLSCRQVGQPMIRQVRERSPASGTISPQPHSALREAQDFHDQPLLSSAGPSAGNSLTMKSGCGLSKAKCAPLTIFITL